MLNFPGVLEGQDVHCGISGRASSFLKEHCSGHRMELGKRCVNQGDAGWRSLYHCKGAQTDTES